MLVERTRAAPPHARVGALPDRRVREVTVLHPAVSARYTALVAAVAQRVEEGLSRSVAANRISAASVDPPRLVLRSFRHERAAFGSRLARLAHRAPCLLFADVRECYPSIAPGVVRSGLRDLGCDGSSAEAIAAFLRGLEERGVAGLPVGPDPSAVLANAVLAGADRSLERLGAVHLRWVDDLVVAVEGSDEAAAVLDVIRAALGRAGLRLNDAKTRLVWDLAPGGLPQGVSVARSRKSVG